MTPTVQLVTNILSFGTVLADILALLLIVIILTPLSEKGWGKKIADFFGDHAIVFSFLITAGSVVGSLFYSEFAHFAPCELCWIERALIYPQAIVLLFALVARGKKFAAKFDNFARTVCLVLSGIDFPVSAYHTYLQLGGRYVRRPVNRSENKKAVARMQRPGLRTYLPKGHSRQFERKSERAGKK
jgi:hypothetical protein